MDTRQMPVWFIRIDYELDDGDDLEYWYGAKPINTSTDLSERAILGFGTRPTGETIKGQTDWGTFKTIVEDRCTHVHWLDEPWGGDGA